MTLGKNSSLRLCYNVQVAHLGAFPTSRLHHHRPDRAALNKLGLDHRLAGVFFSLADITDPAHDAVHYRAVAPADMRDRWPTLALKYGSFVDADQGKILRHPEALVE